MSRIIVTYDVLNKKEKVVRQVEVEVESRSGWEEEAELAAIDKLTEGETLRFVETKPVSEPPAPTELTPESKPEVSTLSSASAEPEPSKDTAPPSEATPIPEATQQSPEQSVFTFDFEIYLDGKLTRTVSRSAQAVDEGNALEAAVAVVAQELTEGETYRYTNRFTKQAIKQ